ncbi:hypothetical protein MSSIT_2062 [Methanosarcina siciliae T4/M]|uniref:Yip1 domain-containing protein n=2 Tax=Methanosarcina siciliae TaxID=38027 RepID=A0A0E3PEN0_9EURY|nr:YIP1 family protein [Methanosarcina siciliae]AKB28781.1 hypothetical protein MSSIT_2062 [Methanosarcina siciliae T4/M]AKB32713.1 hypothetical protein MSSIH_2023 [Methanosarcina siciliae HI350]
MQIPPDFFRKMPTTGGYFYPVVFATGSAAILTATRLIFSPDKNEPIELVSLATTVMAVILLAISLTALFVDAAGLYIIYKVLGGTGTYEGTARFVLYSSASHH